LGATKGGNAVTEDARQAWSEVGEKFASWGRGVADRYREAGPTESAAAKESQRELERTARELMDELSRGFTAVADTLRDEQARQQLMEAVTAVGEAITATFDEAAEGIRSGKTSARGSHPGRAEEPGKAEEPGTAEEPAKPDERG
jgi:hypothetical protein